MNNKPVYALLIFISITAALVVFWNSLLTPRSEPCRCRQFKEMMVLLQTETTINGKLPPAQIISESNEIIHSWRVPLILSCKQIKYPANSPWDSNVMISSEEAGEDLVCDVGSTETFLMAVTGTDTVFGERLDISEVDSKNLIILIESSAGDVHWMSPIDLDVSDILIEDSPLGSPNSRGFCVAFADGAVWCLDKKTPRSTLEPFLKISISSERNELLLPYKLNCK